MLKAKDLLFVLLATAFSALGVSAAEPGTASLEDSVCRLVWTRSPDGWRLREASVALPGGAYAPVGDPSGEYTVLYKEQAPAKERPALPWLEHEGEFPETIYRYTTPTWKRSTTPVALNTEGEALYFFPAGEERRPDGTLIFTAANDKAELRAEWRLDPAYPGDVRATLTLKAKKDGYYSLATPTLATLSPESLGWACVPGYFQGDKLNPDFVNALAYGHGLPERPVLVRERSASTLSPLMTNKDGATLAVVPDPGTAADPWAYDRSTRNVWKLGLSHMNRRARLSPTLYHPVLGEDGSQLKAGETLSFGFRYVLRRASWYEVVRHTAADLYRFGAYLSLEKPTRSLSQRLLSLHDYVTDDKTSLWRTESYLGLELGAQAYLGGVVGSDKDAMKNSDYGAMWMLGSLTNDPRLVRDRLPFARNFKLVQQQKEPGFFQGAAIGQYYLSKSRRFAEEWGDYVEPVGVTYYTMLDLGNILLFTPQDEALRERLRLGAERLLSWQHPDGSWEIAYDHASEKPLFRELPDYRPTFYGLLVAYRILGDARYLEGAKRGADWLLATAVKEGRFVGVCGDNRFAPDFATAQIAQGLLDLHELTAERRYLDGAVATARFYTTSVYTHPVPDRGKRVVNGVEREAWEISQVGLGFEHGGAIGSANNGGPILLASHAPLFLRVYALTGDAFFRDLARAAAFGRDAFVEPKTSVASYYWSNMNRGAGPYPHHAWWQIGWITDYLVSEAAVRSSGGLRFPRGFMTPKVGPHCCYGFAPGSLFGKAVKLHWGAVETGSPEIDYLIALSPDEACVYVVLLNEKGSPLTARVAPADPAVFGSRVAKAAAWLDEAGKETKVQASASPYSVAIPAYGMRVLKLVY